MQFELLAHSSGLVADDLTAIMQDREISFFTKVEIFSTALGNSALKEPTRTEYKSLILGHGSDANGAVMELTNSMRRLEIMTALQANFAALPWHSVYLTCPIQLARPYLSRDDDALYIIENPVRKEKVFQVPFVAGSSWKGALRAVARRQMQSTMAARVASAASGLALATLLEATLWPMRTAQIRIFGNEKQEDADFIEQWLAEQLWAKTVWHAELGANLQAAGDFLADSFRDYLIAHGYRSTLVEGRRGRLACFPTYFDRIGLEIINPHKRATRVGTVPVTIEAVPAGATGHFALLYTPFDVGAATAEEVVVTPTVAALYAQMAVDLPIIAQAVHELLLLYGFGAKTSSGYGLAKDLLATSGQLFCKARLAQPPPQLGAPSAGAPSAAPGASYLETHDRLIAEFRADDDSLISKEEYEARLQKSGKTYNKSAKQQYEKAAKWWAREGRERWAAAATPVTAAQPTAPVLQDLPTYEFRTVSELLQLVTPIAAAFQAAVKPSGGHP